MTRIPAEFREGLVYLRVSINNGAPVWMALDINASASTLYAARATRATVRSGIIAQPVTFRQAPPSGACAPDGTIVAGRLGNDWLGDRVAEIRTREHEVWLSAPVIPPPASIERPIVAASLTN